ncbi:MAG: drug/metabolite exporter YedA [bacterium]|nr:drug/metabolite exporter YedA [bacterium]
MTVKVQTPVLVEETSTAQLEQVRRFKVGLALLSVYVIWGSTYLALRIGIETMPPFFLTGTRFLIAGGLMFAFLRLRGAPMPTGKEWRNAAIIGTLMLGFGTGGVAFAEQWVDSGLAAVAVAVVPVWVALFTGLTGRWPTRMEWVGLVIGLAGVGLLNLENGMRANPQGAAALILGPICWATGSILSRHLALPKGFMASAVEMIGGGAVLMTASLLLGERLTQTPSLPSVLALIYLITFGSWIGFSAYMYLLKEVRPALATSYAYVNPIVAVALGAVFVGERITPVGIVAMLVILSGVVMVAFGREKQNA